MKLVFDDFSNVCFIQNWTRMTSILLLDLCTFMITNSLYSFQNQKCFKNNYVENIKTHVSYSITFFRKSYRL